jgi:uncharacterized protein
MKLTQAQDRGLNLVRSYGDGEVRIGEQRLTAPCLVAADALVAQWTDKPLAALDEASLEPIWKLEPLIVLMGTTAAARLAPAAVRRSFQQRGIALETMELGAACRTYNVLAQEHRPVVAALFP